MEAKKDCIFYDEKRKDCKALKLAYCQIESKCNFYKCKGAENNGLEKDKH